VKKHVLILGAGFAGLELAAQLSESLRDEVRVTLLDHNDSFSFGFSKLDVMLGRRAAEDLRLYYREISLEGVEFRQERVTSIDPDQRRVTTDAASYDSDVLAVALGADYDFAATPGFQEGGYEYYSIAGAERLRDALPGFDSGTILIGILGHPFKCPPAPFEGALLLHDHFLERGNREAVEIRVIGPMAAPVPVTQELSQAFLDALGARRIEYVPNQLVTSIGNGQAQLASGGSVPYDHFIEIPVHRVPEVVESSGLAADGWVPVNRAEPGDTVPGRLRARGRGSPADGQGGRIRRGRRARSGGGDRRPAPWRRTAPTLRGRRPLLRRVRRRARRQGRGQLPRGTGADGRARRTVARAHRREAGVRLDQGSALVRLGAISGPSLSAPARGRPLSAERSRERGGGRDCSGHKPGTCART
jgi:sulfide:quinone oxidoreductase